MEEEKSKKKRLTFSSIKQTFVLYSYIRPYQGKFILGLIFLVLSSLSNLAFPYFLGQLIDAPLQGATPEEIENATVHFEEINRIALVLAAVLIAQATFSFFRVVLFVNVAENALASLRQATYKHLIKLPISFFNSRRVGELNSRISSDISLLQETMTTTLAEFVRQMVIITGGIAFLVYTSWNLTLLVLAVIPVVVLIAIFFGRFIRKYSKKVQSQVAESNTIVEETLQGIFNVKAFANEFLEMARYTKKTDDVAKTGIKGGVYRGAFSAFIVLGIFGAIVAVIWQGVTLVENGDIRTGELVQFILFSIFIGASIGSFADVYAKIQKAVGATEELMEIFDESPEELHEEVKDLPGFVGKVKFDNVKFSYPSRTDVAVLKGVSFEVNSGEQVALVGPSGAGKSTIVQLVMRFFDPIEGNVFFDEKKSTEYSLTDLRAQMAVVPQDVLLFGGSIRENIAYGKPNASEEEIIEAAKQANAWKFISEFPEGLDTVVGDRGVQLSGGQRQRVAIARAVLKDPKILILDEATSALDSESERLVQDALDKLMQGRTSIVIAHRLSTIRSADKILVLEDGKVVESGTHDELSAQEGIYHQLANMQFNV